MKRVVRAVVISSLAGACVIACVDLFHDTDDVFPRACADGGCSDAPIGDGGPVGPVVVCESEASRAVETAKTACAWLGACAGPYGINEPGACMLEALRAYDCAVDPLNVPREDRAAFWSCLRAASSARSCGDVTRCVFPKSTHSCGTNLDTFACPNVGETAGADRFVRVFCHAGEIAGGENCAAVGGHCLKLGEAPAYQGCSTALPPTEAPDCTRSSCQSGERLTVCSDDLDGGVELAELECAQSGGGRCGSGIGAGPGCIGFEPNTDASCQPDLKPYCSGKLATRCSNGVTEEVDCARLGLDCDATGAVQTHEACKVAAGDAGDAGSSCVSECDEGDPDILHACMRGLPVTVTCSQLGLGKCHDSVGADGVTTISCSTPNGG